MICAFSYYKWIFVRRIFHCIFFFVSSFWVFHLFHINTSFLFGRCDPMRSYCVEKNVFKCSEKMCESRRQFCYLVFCDSIYIPLLEIIAASEAIKMATKNACAFVWLKKKNNLNFFIIVLSHLSKYIFSIKWFQWNTQSSKKHFYTIPSDEQAFYKNSIFT